MIVDYCTLLYIVFFFIIRRTIFIRRVRRRVRVFGERIASSCVYTSHDDNNNNYGNINLRRQPRA